MTTPAQSQSEQPDDSLTCEPVPGELGSEPAIARFTISRTAYLAVAMLFPCVTVLVRNPALIVVYLIPVAVAVYIARTATIVASDGIAVRALLGTRIMAWSQIKGLSVTGRNIYAVLDSGSVRLPCVRLADLAALSRASNGHLPELAEATPKYAPQAHRRR